jgi:hypothetical protein
LGRGEQGKETGVRIIHLIDEIVVTRTKEMTKMRKTLLAAALALAILTAGSAVSAPATDKEPLDAQTLNTIGSQFGKLMELANKHDIKAIHEMFWQSPSAGATRRSIGNCTISPPPVRPSFNRTFRSSGLLA